MTKFKPKLVALDVDGTIMDRTYRVSGRVKKAINAAVKQGVYVVLATGRMYSATVPLGIELGLKTPLVVYQGSLIKEFYKSDKELLHHKIPMSLANELINDLFKENVQTNAYFDDKLYTQTDSLILQEYISRRKIPFYQVKSFEEVKNFAPTKVMAMDPDIEKIDRIKAKFIEKYSDRLNITKSTDYFCEFVDVKCSKADAILFLAEMWGIKQSETMAVGDQDNDKGMIQAAGIGVAMGNGHDDLKQVADFTTDTVEKDGAALAIERFVLQ